MNKPLSIIFFFTLIAMASNAQNLPNVQKESMWAPANIKIDGKTPEWNNQFKAYNHATSLFYNLSNDDENLYWTMQATDVDALTKITGAGIIFNINSSQKKDDEGAVSITYPFFEINKKPFLSFKNLPKILSGSSASVLKADSIMRMMNKRLDEKSKYIKIIGIVGLDTLTSVYNDEGIKAREAFDNTMAYTCELAIPLKYLSLSANKAAKIYYHIILPGLKVQDLGIIVEKDAYGKIISVSSAPGAGGSIPSKDHLNAIYATTDFWGEYTLAKKP